MIFSESSKLESSHWTNDMYLEKQSLRLIIFLSLCNINPWFKSIGLFFDNTSFKLLVLNFCLINIIGIMQFIQFYQNVNPFNAFFFAKMGKWHGHLTK